MDAMTVFAIVCLPVCVVAIAGAVKTLGWGVRRGFRLRDM